MPRFAHTLFLFTCLAAGLAMSACKKSTVVEAEVNRVDVTREQCFQDVTSLRTFLATIEKEGDVSAEVSPGPTQYDRYFDRAWPHASLHLHLLPEEAPKPMGRTAMVNLSKGTARFAETLGAVDDPEALSHVMKTANASGLAFQMGFGGLGYMHMVSPVNLLIDADEPWSHVVTFVNAAAANGFWQAEMIFETKSGVAPPPSTPITKQMTKIAKDNDQMPYMRDRAAAKELARQTPLCPKIAKPFSVDADTSSQMDAQREEFMVRAATEYLDCGCHADVNVIKAFAWSRYGRHWGPTTTTYGVEIRNPNFSSEEKNRERVVELQAPAPTTKWRDAATIVIEASKRKDTVTFR